MKCLWWDALSCEQVWKRSSRMGQWMLSSAGHVGNMKRCQAGSSPYSHQEALLSCSGRRNSGGGQHLRNLVGKPGGRECGGHSKLGINPAKGLSGYKDPNKWCGQKMLWDLKEGVWTLGESQRRWAWDWPFKAGTLGMARRQATAFVAKRATARQEGAWGMKEGK